jgi:transcription-repair coupling factor (superfamily II helicase)
MKQNTLVGYFISDQNSSFYQSENFTKVLHYVQNHSQSIKMKEKQTRKGLRLLITFANIKNVDNALQVIRPILA